MEAAGDERQTAEHEEGEGIRHRLRAHPHHTHHTEHHTYHTQKGGQQSRPGAAEEGGVWSTRAEGEPCELTLGREGSRAAAAVRLPCCGLT